MRRWMWMIPLALIVTAVVTTTPVWSYDHPTEMKEFTDPDRISIEDPVGLSRFAAECDEVFNTVKTTLSTYVSTVVTVVKAIVNLMVTVVVAVAKLGLRFAGVLVKAVAGWLLSLIF